MGLLGACLLMLSACMAVFIDRRQFSARNRCLDSFITAFRQLAREVVSTGAPLGRLLARLPQGEAAEYLKDRVENGLSPLTEEQKAVVKEACSLLGGFDADTQANGLLHAAAVLEKQRTELMDAAPEQMKVRQAIALSAAAVAAILLL